MLSLIVLLLISSSVKYKLILPPDKIVETKHIKKYLESYKDKIDVKLFERIYEIEKYRKNISNRYGISQEIKKRTLDYFKGGYSEIK